MMIGKLLLSTQSDRVVWALLVFLWFLSPLSVRSETTQPSQRRETKTPSDKPPVRVQVDPRVELFSIIFCLAGDGMYNMGLVESYSKNVQEHFGPFRDHSVVKLARKLRSTGGMGVDSPMSLAVHVEDTSTLREIVPFDRKPRHLDPNWTVERARDFLEAARQFVKDAKFEDFIKEHQPLYRTTESRLEAFLTQHAHLEWFDEFFGKRPGARFTVVPALLNGGASYGPRCRTADGKESLYSIMGVWQTDDDGVPQFLQGGIILLVVHEFCHSYTNRIINQHAAQLEPAGRKIFPHVAAAMKKQGYRHWENVMYESLVRACTVRYVDRYYGGAVALKVIQSEEAKQFLWIGGLSKLLAEYETHRDRYVTLEEFMPGIVAFFEEYAGKIDPPKTSN